mgnify:CR=1 FL=1
MILDNKKLYTDKRWNQPLGGKIIGTAKPLTEEEQKKVDEEFEEFRYLRDIICHNDFFLHLAIVLVCSNLN